MTQPDAEHIVRYKAVADFSELFIQATAAEARLRALQAEANKAGGGGASNPAALLQQQRKAVDDLTAAERARQRVEQDITNLKPAQIRAEEKHTQVLEERQKKAQEALRSQQALNMLAGDRKLHDNVVNDLKTENDLLERVAQNAAKTAQAHSNAANAESRAAAQRSKTAASQLRDEQSLAVVVERTAAATASRVGAEERAGAAAHRRVAQQQVDLHNVEKSAASAAMSEERHYQLLTGGARKAATDVERLAQLRARGMHVAEAADRAEEAGLLRIQTLRERLSQLEQRRPQAASGGGGNIISGIATALDNLGDMAGGKLGRFAKTMFSFRGLIILALATLGPLIAALGSLGAAAIGAANTLGYLGGSAAALPGLFAAAVTGIGALTIALIPMLGVLKAWQAQQKLVSQGTAQLALAQHEAAQKTADAQHAYQDASKAVRDAQFEETRAQVSLNEARVAATRDLEDLRKEVNRASLNEQGAILNLRQAQLDYRKSLADSNATALDRQQSLYRVQVAENELADVRTKNKRNAQDLAVAERKGVEGSDQVVSARKAVTDASYATANAQYQLQKSSYDLAQAQKEQAAGGQQLYQANLALAGALENLGPKAQKVAGWLTEQGAAWRKLQADLAEDIFGPVSTRLGSLNKLLPVVNDLLGKAATAIGGVVAKGLDMISSGPWVKDFGTIADANATIISNLGDAALSVAAAFKDIAVAATPFTGWLTAAIAKVAKGFADWADSARNSGAIASFLKTTEERLIAVWKIVGNLFTLFTSLFFASSNYSGGMLDAIVKITDKWATWGKTQEKVGSSFQNWLNNTKPLLHAIAGAAGALAIVIGRIAADPRNIREAERIFNALATKVLPPLVGIFGKLADSHAISKLVDGFGSLFSSVERFLNNGGSLFITNFFTELTKILAGLVWVISQPGLAQAFGFIFAALATLSAGAVIGHYTGLFKLIDLFARFGSMRGILRELGGLLKDIFTGHPIDAMARVLGWLIGSFKFAAALLKDLLTGKALGTTMSSRGGKAVQTEAEAAEARRVEQEGSRWNTLLAHVREHTTLLGEINAKLQEKITLEIEMNRLLAGIATDIGLLRTGGGIRAAAPATAGRVPSSATRGGVVLGESAGVEGAAAEEGAAGALRGSAIALNGAAEQLLLAARALSRAAGMQDLSNLGPGSIERDAEKAAGRKAETTVAEDAAKAAGKPSLLSRLFGRGGTAAAATAGEEAATHPGVLARVAGTLGKAARVADPLAWAGLAASFAADSGWLGKPGSAGKQLGQLGGAVLGGAGVGAGIGALTGPLAPIAAPVGAVVGAAAGGAYSLYKDKGLRERVGNTFRDMGPVGHALAGLSPVGAVADLLSNTTSVFGDKGAKTGLSKTVSTDWSKTYEGFMRNVGSPVAHWFEVSLPHGFGKIGDFFTKDIPHWWHKGVSVIETFFTKTLPRLPGMLLKELERLPHQAARALGFIGGYLWQSFANAFKKAEHWFRDFGGNVRKWWNSWTFAEVWDKFYSHTIRPIVGWFKGLPGAVRRWWDSWKFSELWDKFYAHTIGPVVGWFKGLPGAIRKWWDSWKFTDLWDKLYANSIGPVIGWFKGLPAAVRSWWDSWSFGDLWEKFKDAVIKPIEDWFVNLPGRVADWLKGLWGDIRSGFSQGQKAAGRQSGGVIEGPRDGRVDTIMVPATGGEFFTRKRVVDKPYGREVLHALNNEQVDPAQLYAALNANVSGAVRVNAPFRAVTAASVTNNTNSRNGGLSMGNVTIHNPVREPSERTLRRKVRSLAYMANR